MGEMKEQEKKKFKRVPVEGGAVGIADGQERGALGIVVERGIDELGGRVKSMRQRRSSLPRGDLLWCEQQLRHLAAGAKQGPQTRWTAAWRSSGPARYRRSRRASSSAGWRQGVTWKRGMDRAEDVEAAAVEEHKAVRRCDKWCVVARFRQRWLGVVAGFSRRDGFGSGPGRQPAS